LLAQILLYTNSPSFPTLLHFRVESTIDESSQFGDKGYFSDEKKRDLRKKGVYCGILDKGKRDHPLSTRQKQRNKQKSRVRCAVERPFAHMKKWYGYVRARYVNLKRNDLHFTFLCIIYNVRRGIVLIES